MAEKSGTLGIMRGLKNVLLLRRERRMAEAKQELQNVKFQMLQRQYDLQEQEHKDRQALRKAQMERDKYVKTDQGWMDITTRTIVPGTESQPKQQPLSCQ